ncbi:MAG: putative kinase, pfkB family carbohydrate kinase family, partial [Mycobacterium sp.]|nr:putative kinase, pfkB family carbohydrate kinase family [Mycobacterium sp.]
MRVVVVGQIGRDLILRCRGLPDSGDATEIEERHELLGGKGANQAVALAQLGMAVSLLGVVGEDVHGAWLLEQAAADGIDTSGVVRRGASALLVDLVDAPGSRRLFEDVPPAGLLRPADVERSGALFDAAECVSLQLQQPAEAMVMAARAAKSRGLTVFADGNPQESSAAELLPMVDVLRLDAQEAQLLSGDSIDDVAAGLTVADGIRRAGPGIVAVAVPGIGDLVVWSSGHHLVRHGDAEVIDQTGAGDAFVAGLIAALCGGADPARAGDCAGAAAGSTVQRLGGRPDLSG